MPNLTQGPMTEFQILLVMGIATYLTVGPILVAVAALAGYIGRRQDVPAEQPAQDVASRSPVRLAEEAARPTIAA